MTIGDILRAEQPEPSRVAWDEWDTRMKAGYGWWSALQWSGFDESGNPFIVSWHWRHRRYASWRIYRPPNIGEGCMRFVGITRLHGTLVIAWWLSGVIILRAASGARDIPSTYWEVKAPAIHDATGDYAGGGRDGATAREWPDVPPVRVGLAQVLDRIRREDLKRRPQ